MLGRTNTGGGGGGLNFQVVGNPQPTNPKENTIWLNTDVKITGYDFSPTESENPVEGMAWISIGTSSTVAFNALKKNEIQVHPIFAKQYINGAWVNVVAKTYQDGEWVEWITDIVIYENGVQNKPLKTTQGNVTFLDEYIKLVVNKNASIFRTEEKTDITHHNTVSVDFFDKTSDAEIAIKISDGTNVITRENLKNSTSGTVSCDISSISGEHYIEVQLYHTGSAKASVNKIKLIK